MSALIVWDPADPGLYFSRPLLFEAVEIIRATDEDVERFAVQVGNDTDPARRSRYSRMPCLIWPECDLSQNTRRILQRSFGQVQVMTMREV